MEAARAEIGREADTRAAAERERDRALSDNERLSAELKGARETAKQAKMALDLDGKKIRQLEMALEEERKALAELRVEAATLAERAAHAEELRELLREFHKQTPAKPAERTRRKKEADTPEE